MAHRRALLPLALLLLVSACGGGGTSGPAAALPRATVVVQDAAADQAAIAKTWAAFFNPAGSVAEHVALLENGEKFVAELTKQAKDPAAQDLSAKATASVVTGDKAAVTYDLYGKDGAVLLKDANGEATRVAGEWKVSQFTYCQLVALQDAKVAHPGCA